MEIAEPFCLRQDPERAMDEFTELINRDRVREQAT
jgi:hypothetical protein